MIEPDAPHFDHSNDMISEPLLRIQKGKTLKPGIYSGIQIEDIVASAVEAVADVVHDMEAGGPGSGRHKEIATAIKDWVSKSGETPDNINHGHCQQTALYVKGKVPEAKAISYPGHTFIEYGGKAYDAEHPNGVDNFKNLNRFNEDEYKHYNFDPAERQEVSVKDLKNAIEESEPIPESLKSIKGASKASYPDDHKAGMRVPKGGSSCASCEYLEDGNKCNNKYFIKWNGSKELPAPADEYCSDWYEEKKDISAGGPGSGRRPYGKGLKEAYGLHDAVKNWSGQPSREEYARRAGAIDKLRDNLKPYVDKSTKLVKDAFKSANARVDDAKSHANAGRFGAALVAHETALMHYHSILQTLTGGKMSRKELGAASETSLAGIQKGSIWNGIRIIGFNGPQEEGLRAMLSRIPPEMLFNVKQIESAKELNAKHGRFIPETKTMLFNPVNFILRQRFGRGDGWMYHAETTVCHEVGHSVYEALTPEKKREWQRLSGWSIGWKEGQSVPYTELRQGWEKTTSKWTHKLGIKFPRHYSERNPNEDFADCFSFFILNKAHQMEKTKRVWLEQLFKDNVKSYSQVSIQSPTKPYGTRKR